MTVALMEAGVVVGGMSRRQLLDSVHASVALDVATVAMSRMYSTQERPYAATRDELTKTLTKAAKKKPAQMTDRDIVAKGLVSMAKYRKAR